MATRRVKQKKNCICCNRNLVPTGNFYNINANDPIYPDGLYNICKECCEELVKDEITGYKSFIRILMAINKPFKSEEFEELDGDYIKYLTLASSKRFKGEFIDSESFFSASAINLNESTINQLTPDELRDCQLFWGKGDYEEDDYIYLMARYEEYNNMYDIDSPAFKGLVAQICQLELDVRKKRIQGINTKDETKLIQDLMKTAGIAPSQEKAALDNSKETMGTLIKKFENEHPIPEPLPEFKDVDGIAKQFRVYFLSPMLKIFGKENPYAHEYEDTKSEYSISREDLLDEAMSVSEEDEL